MHCNALYYTVLHCNAMCDATRLALAATRLGPAAYRDLLVRSVFALCPSGYRPTSYRIYEVIGCHNS